MLKCPTRVALALGLVVGLGPTAGKAQEINVILALPAATLTFSAPFLAEDAGFFKREGLKVSVRNIVGVGSVNAVLAGSADFTMGTGPVFLRAAAQGQRMYAIANLVDRPLVELVLRKDVAEAAGITDKMPLAERAKAMKGKTIAIQGVGSIVHAWQRLVAHRGGLDLEKDVRIAPMDPPAMLPALENKAIDGYATSMPFTTQAIVKGSAVMLASAASDAPDLVPFAYGLVYAKPRDLPRQARDVRPHGARAGGCRQGSSARSRPRRWRSCASASTGSIPQMLDAAWQVALEGACAGHAGHDRGLENSQRVSLEAGLLAEKDALKSFEGLFTDEFLR